MHTLTFCSSASPLCLLLLWALAHCLVVAGAQHVQEGGGWIYWGADGAVLMSVGERYLCWLSNMDALKMSYTWDDFCEFLYYFFLIAHRLWIGWVCYKSSVKLFFLWRCIFRKIIELKSITRGKNEWISSVFVKCEWYLFRWILDTVSVLRT